MTEAHLQVIRESLRPRQPAYAIMTGLLAVLGLGFQLLGWNGGTTSGERLTVALVTGVPLALGIGFMLRAQLRRNHPLVRRLRGGAPGLTKVALAYVAFSDRRLAQLSFEFADRKRWNAYVPESLGEAVLRDAQAQASGPAATRLPEAIVVETGGR
jgi:hypothetical protein